MTIRILTGDVFEQLAQLEADSFDMAVTSPPYWGLRDYGVAGQLGLEPTLGEHLDVMVRVFREVRRVLKPEGTLWLNYGDCYATTPNGRSAADTKLLSDDDRTFRDKPFSTVGPIYKQTGPKVSHRRDRAMVSSGTIAAGGYLKVKDLCMVPNRLAIALQEDGWWVRSEIIWGKPNPMPDSAGKYRPSTAHEKIWMLAKSAKYFYDPEAVAQAVSERTNPRVAKSATAGKQAETATSAAAVGASSGRRMAGFNERWVAKQAGVTPKSAAEDTNVRAKGSFHASTTGAVETRYLRNYEPAPLEVWEIASQAFPEAHFATFPPELARRCIEAACPPGGHVLDPFGGAGTTGLVADQLRRNATLIELNPEYVEIARRRVWRDGALFDGWDWSDDPAA